MVGQSRVRDMSVVVCVFVCVCMCACVCIYVCVGVWVGLQEVYSWMSFDYAFSNMNSCLDA